MNDNEKTVSADSFMKNNNVYDHICNVHDHYSYEIRFEISVMSK